ncbi:hypothetical protein H2200_010865 [Cladophialophora chaetospira]|uniref:Aflatoxin biosynthesis ketoreductase nor-1 n=1 Tax=Cladophialophora chaetospira TaxID=386627 RepID=A0AA38X0X7_9EURO|nr:hypothetical protein H2200_010865 [Cladophialophora chaetospira]
MPIAYLVTGANRGIGRGLVEIYLSQPHGIVVAAVRDPAHPTSQSLKNLPKEQTTTLIIVQIRSESATDAVEAVKELKTSHGVNVLDVVVANAGYGNTDALVPIASARPADMIEHYQINAIGPVVLFGAVLPLLQKSQSPKFVTISSAAGSIEGLSNTPFPMTAYGSSKAALNWLTVKIHHEHPNIIAFPMHPGFIQTDMGNAGAAAWGVDKAPFTLDRNVPGIAEVVGHPGTELLR